MDNLGLGADAQANHALGLLRGNMQDRALEDRMELAPGIMMFADPALGLQGRLHSPEGRLLEIEARMSGPGGWFGLHIGLGGQDLTHHGIVGLVCRVAAPRMQVMRAALRSGVEGGFVDCFFDKHILAPPEGASHLDAIPLAERDTVPPHAPWRELVLFMPVQDFQLGLQDLRVFIV